MVVTALWPRAARRDRAAVHRGLDNLDQVDFIYEVGPFSFIVALLAGAAGMLALTSAKSLAGRGVHLGDHGAGGGVRLGRAGRGPLRAGRQLGVQLLVNLVGIVVAAVAVLLLSRRVFTGQAGGGALSEG